MYIYGFESFSRAMLHHCGLALVHLHIAVRLPVYSAIVHSRCSMNLGKGTQEFFFLAGNFLSKGLGIREEPTR